jgi:hypothetical protein
VKAFLLDPPRNSAPSSGEMPKFMQIAAAHAGWSVERATAFSSGMSGPQWLGSLRDKLERADIIVSLGNYLALLQSNHELPCMLDIIRRKIDAGSPILLDGCAGLWGGAFADLNSQIIKLLNYYGIRLTPKTVASRIHEFSPHSSSSCCVFHKTDDCLLDPDLFDDVDTVAASGNRLLQYEPDVYPLIESNNLHFFVDEGDWETRGNLGKKNAIAVRRLRNNENVFVLTGSFFDDPTKTMGGILPSIQDNRGFATNLIEKLDTLTRRSFASSASAYELFRELEARIGELIESVLSRVSSDGSFVTLLPPKIQEKLRPKPDQIDFSLATFVQLVTIIKDLWPRFARFFIDKTGQPLGRELVTTPLFNINTHQRRYFAHPHKAKQQGLTLTAEDVAELKSMLEILRLASVAATKM